MATATIDKPKYIRKYDFIRYYQRPQDQWFWPNKQITTLLSVLSKKEEYQLTYEDDDEGEDYEFDAYEYFRSFSSDICGDMDENDPKIIEGKIIDKKSREFIKQNYPTIKNIYDFDDKVFFSLDQEEQFNKIKEIIKEGKDFIAFQPTFLYKNTAIAKPDALVFYNGKFILIETKGTSTNKVSHLIDITYQYFVLSATIEIDDIFVCLIKYELLDKNNISFVLVPYYCLSAKPSDDVKDYEKYSPEWIEQRSKMKMYVSNPPNYEYAKFIYLLKHCLDPISSIKPPFDPSTKRNSVAINNWTKNLNDFQINYCKNFDKTINELKKADICRTPDFSPNILYKDCGYWKEIKDYYAAAHKYPTFSYSGYLVRFDTIFKKNLFKEEDLFHYFQGCEQGKAANTYYTRKINNNKVLGRETKKIYDRYKLHRIKVYFDFETLNLATRVIDDSLPYSQIVNQVSVIITRDNKELVNRNVNIVIDPLKITLQDFKDIVDAIYYLDDNASYIVYNKSFEKSRLEEIKNYLKNEPDYEIYENKIDMIINNIFDLADFFDPRKVDQYLFFDQLHGGYSIKKVLPLIKKLRPKLFELTKCVDYHDLDIHNGGEAQGEASRRFFKIYDDKKWKEIATNLKAYCENDVRAMIAVDYFVDDLVQTNRTKKINIINKN